MPFYYTMKWVFGQNTTRVIVTSSFQPALKGSAQNSSFEALMLMSPVFCFQHLGVGRRASQPH